jgi:hypothetical protein
MNTAGHEYPKIVTVEVTDRWIIAGFSDGRQISLPLAWSWRLERAEPAQRANLELIGDGEGVRWPEIDEDLSARGFFVARRLHRPGLVPHDRPAPPSLFVHSVVPPPSSIFWPMLPPSWTV